MVLSHDSKCKIHVITKIELRTTLHACSLLGNIRVPLIKFLQTTKNKTLYIRGKKQVKHVNKTICFKCPIVMKYIFISKLHVMHVLPKRILPVGADAGAGFRCGSRIFLRMEGECVCDGEGGGGTLTAKKVTHTSHASVLS